jgi:hypothetical protein
MISISQQITYQRNRLRKNKREKAILLSLKTWQMHFGIEQSNTNVVIGLSPAQFGEWFEFIDKKKKS